MKQLVRILTITCLVTVISACGSGNKDIGTNNEKNKTNYVKKRRDDGTLSSINPIDENGYVHGVKVMYYEDGKTVHSKVSYEHGRKHGPAIWYYKNGQIHEHSNYYYNRKNGLAKRYYDTGELMEEVTFDTGQELPGKKMYTKDGELITE